jgi:hypothetical protein
MPYGGNLQSPDSHQVGKQTPCAYPHSEFQALNDCHLSTRVENNHNSTNYVNTERTIKSCHIVRSVASIVYQSSSFLCHLGLFTLVNIYNQ